MKLEDQVCSLELAKRLNELGVKQDSLFWWVAKKDKLLNKGIRIFEIVYVEWFSDLEYELNNYESYAAFTVAELGEMIPSTFNKNENELLYIAMDCDKHIYYENIDGKDEIYYDEENDDDNEADSRAKMLIYLIENGFIDL